MNHTILFIFAFVAIVFAKPPIKGSGTSSEEKAEPEVPDVKERRSVKDRVTQQPEESTDVTEISSPVFVAVVAKKFSAVTAVPSADAKNSSQAKEVGIIVV
ncbi:unnamed protein product [Cylicocyclus nassatus]|uniref:Uncharacterized protein n=1 Tax=Cylicocyclus nassatus TaxID=53992 RepID=A0AA36DRM8_CYLNA|nr:unnamed protein product [Cylicocyclus nassatus]